MTLLPTEATTEEKTRYLHGPTPSHIPLKTAKYSRKFGFMHLDTSLSTQVAKMGQKNLRREGVTGSPMSA